MGLTQYTIERKFPVSPEALYRAFTNPSELALWVWGLNAGGVHAVIDLRPNGIVQVFIEEKGRRKSAMRGIYLVIEPNHKLIHTVHWDADVGYNRPGTDPLDEIQSVSFTPDGEGCLLRYVHMGIPDDGKSTANHENGVRATLDGLDKLLQSR